MEPGNEREIIQATYIFESFIEQYKRNPYNTRTVFKTNIKAVNYNGPVRRMIELINANEPNKYLYKIFKLYEIQLDKYQTEHPEVVDLDTYNTDLIIKNIRTAYEAQYIDKAWFMDSMLFMVVQGHLAKYFHKLDIRLARAITRVECPCGALVQINNLTKHKKTSNHLARITV